MEKYLLINVQDIPEGGKQFETRWDKPFVESLLQDAADAGEVQSPLELKCTMERHGTEVILNVSCSVQIKLNCTSCLDDYIYTLDSCFRYVCRPGLKEAGPEEQELQSEDLETFYYEGESIDLKSMVREQIYLHLPQYPRCKDDCAGLCLNCGGNLNRRRCGCAQDTNKESSPFSVLKKLKADR